MFGEGRGVAPREHVAALRHRHGSYNIVVRAGVLSDIGERIVSLGLSGSVLVVTNPVVDGFYTRRLLRSLESASFRTHVFHMPDGEEFKNIAVATAIWEKALESGLDRGSTVLALGGGVVCDTAGFIAATYMRGISFVQVPTTLLAQVDASVGGKVAVNLPGAKNVVGAFYQPEAVFIDPVCLATLDNRELLSGMAEVAKHAVALDLELFEYLEGLDREAFRDVELMAALIAWNVRIKAAVVEEDEFESGLRAVLNLGHTLGHAIESLTGYQVYRHGEGVAVGMACAARLSCALGMLSSRDASRVESLLGRWGMPTTLPPSLSVEAIATEMRKDKKSVAGDTRFVLLDSVGQAVAGIQVPTEVLAGVLRDMGAS